MESKIGDYVTYAVCAMGLLAVAIIFYGSTHL